MIIARQRPRPRRRTLALSALALAGLGLGVVLRADYVRAQDHPQSQSSAASDAADDWQVVTPEADANDGASLQPRPDAKTPSDAASAASAGAFVACSERVTRPSAEVASIVDRINELWGANVRVYQTVAPMPPHAAAGGCIFYNRGALAALMGNRMQVNDSQIAGPLLYAILAHEVGHEMHHDLDTSRANVPVQVKELEADRFAGYTMQKLDVPRGASRLTGVWPEMNSAAAVLRMAAVVSASMRSGRDGTRPNGIGQKHPAQYPPARQKPVTVPTLLRSLQMSPQARPDQFAKALPSRQFSSRLLDGRLPASRAREDVVDDFCLAHRFGDHRFDIEISLAGFHLLDSCTRLRMVRNKQRAAILIRQD